MKRLFCISCYELCTNNITGIQRYMQETIIALDSALSNTSCNIDVRVCYPEGRQLNLPSLINIKKVAIPMKKKENWNTSALKQYVKKENGVFVGMANNFTLSSNSIVTIHDIRALDSKKFESFKQRVAFFVQSKLTSFFSRYLVTVSNYQKNVICRKLHFPEDRVFVTYNGHEHILRIEEDDTILEKFSVLKNDYYYSLGSIAKHKNYKWILEVAKRNPQKTFVVAGGEMLKKWGTDSSDFALDNIVYVGYVSDEENKALLRNCKAYIQPSFYEGFGIPPLEALALGRPIFVSNATCLPEIYQGLGVIFDPYDYDIDLEKIIYPEEKQLKVALAKYSWKKAAKDWVNILERYKK